MKTKSEFNRKVQLSFGSAIAILLVVAAFSYRGMVLSSESDRLVRHTHEILENLQELLFAMQSIELSSTTAASRSSHSPSRVPRFALP
jgi:CHASE3 domain sensor protein